MNAKNGELFPEMNTSRFGDNRRESRLFLPSLIHQESIQSYTRDAAADKAYRVICKWAKMEEAGKLAKMSETAIEGEFLTEVFGEALGYTLFSDDKEQWELQPKFSVDGGIADAAIGLFSHKGRPIPRVVVELKGPTANLDRDRYNGRTAVQQCWDYLSFLPDCPWGIVCNYVSFRLYHRNKGRRVYELFTLDALTDRSTFDEFYCVFQRGGLLPTDDRAPRADVLLQRGNEQQEKVGDHLYQHYDYTRQELIALLKKPPHGLSLEQAVTATQKLLDRVVFVAFCEDRRLLPQNSLKMVHERSRPFAMVTNPLWHNLLDLFASIDKGNAKLDIPPFNGGLFARDDVVDNLDLDDDWTQSFKVIGDFDFAAEVNVEVLGHLFERSVTDLERIKAGGILDSEYESGEAPKMPKSAKRKRYGIYYTPPAFTKFIVRQIVGEQIDRLLADLARLKGIDPNEKGITEPDPARATFWKECLDTLREVKIVDPACGSGAFLIAAYDLLLDKYQDVAAHAAFHGHLDVDELLSTIPDSILRENLFGVDLNQEAVEITQLALWIRSARPDKSLADLSENIVWGNSLVDDPQVHPAAMKWEDKFPQVFRREEKGFDCVIGNPPWSV